MGPNLREMFGSLRDPYPACLTADRRISRLFVSHGEALIKALEKAAEIIVTLEEQYESTFHYEDHREFMELLAQLESEAQL